MKELIQAKDLKLDESYVLKKLKLHEISLLYLKYLNDWGFKEECLCKLANSKN